MTSLMDFYQLLFPTIFLNPILFLHGLNAILSCFLPTLSHYDSRVQPHVDVHANEHLCWGYTAVIVWAQYAAFHNFGRMKEGRDNEQDKCIMHVQEDNGYA